MTAERLDLEVDAVNPQADGFSTSFDTEIGLCHGERESFFSEYGRHHSRLEVGSPRIFIL